MKEMLLLLLGAALAMLGGWLESWRTDRRERERFEREKAQNVSEWRRRVYVALLTAGNELYRCLVGPEKRPETESVQTNFGAALVEVVLAGPSDVAKLAQRYQSTLIMMSVEHEILPPGQEVPEELQPWHRTIEARRELVASMRRTLGLEPSDPQGADSVSAPLASRASKTTRTEGAR